MKYLPFANGQWKMAIGLKPLALETWIEIDNEWAEQLSLKAQLLSQHYADVFASLPGSEAAQREVLQLLIAHLLQHFPQHYQQQGDCLVNEITGQRWTISAFAEPLDLAGRLVQEDLCLLLPNPSGYVLSAASVCFPSRWSVQDKIGKPLAAIHQPVPGYETQLARPVNQLFERLKVDAPGYRLNWSIVDSPDLFLGELSQPTLEQSNHQSVPPPITAADAGDRLWVRVERQTLRRLPVSGGILFTIRTYRYPLRMVASDPIVAQNLAVAIQQIPSAMQGYKNLLPIQSELLTFLEHCSEHN